MAELIYSVKNIFLNSSESCLMDYRAAKYHIAAYQRGYKWSSDEYGAVTILLNDLWEAYNNPRTKEYFLQYITLKKDDTKAYFEVIDGQQRLTTLSILLSILSLRRKNENPAKNKLEYAIRENFFSAHIYEPRSLAALLDMEWNDKMGLCLSESENYNTQDIFYLFHAAKRIDQFFKAKEQDKLPYFQEFLLNCVKIIVNVVDNVSSEKVFKNLNSNKVALTEAELIKGLLLTRYSRSYDDENKKTFREILEYRMVLARQWDEISNWTNAPPVTSFYFEGQDGMNSILELLAIQFGYVNSKKRHLGEHPLFNFFHILGKTHEVYEKLIFTFQALKNWYNDDRTYNLMGYLFFAKGTSKKVSDFLPYIDMSKSDFLDILTQDVKRIIPQEPDKLFYGTPEDDQAIHRVLLALNVFVYPSARFNFYRFKDEKWTLEHIFPQTPGGREKELKPKDHELILDILAEAATEDLRAILKKSILTPEEKELCQNALRSVKGLGAIGNLCLLTDKDNISNSCSFFDEKRTNILGRIRKGSFVPKHTFDVFSKMIFDDNPGDFERWTNENITRHTKIVCKNILSLNL